MFLVSQADPFGARMIERDGAGRVLHRDQPVVPQVRRVQSLQILAALL
jgi:hypothetical protein